MLHLVRNVKMLFSKWLASCLMLGLLYLPSASVATADGGAAAPLTVAVHRQFPPQYSLDSEGNPQGFAIDIIKVVAARAGYPIQFKVYDTWPDIHQAVRSGTVDLVPNLGITASRKEIYRFTEPLETFVIGLFVREGTNNVQSLEDLSGHRVGTVETNAAVKIIARSPALEHKIFPDLDALFFALLSGEVDVLAYPVPVIMQVAQRAGLEGRIKQVGEPLREIKRAVGISQLRPGLYQPLQDEVKALLKSDQYRTIYTRWYGEPVPYWNERRLLLAAALVVGGVLLLALLLVWRYRILVEFNGRLQAGIKEQRKAESAFRLSERSLVEAQRIAKVGSWTLNVHDGSLLWSDEIYRIFGRDPGTFKPSLNAFFSCVHQKDIARVQEAVNQSIQEGSLYHIDHRIVLPDGSIRFVRERGELQRADDDSPLLMIGSVLDITDAWISEQMEQGRGRILEMIATGRPLPEILDTLARHVEKIMPGMFCSILLLDKEGGCLRHGAAPSLPAYYREAIDGLEIGEEVASCGTAAYRGERVVVADVMTHPYWSAYRELAERAGLGACWSEPIISSGGSVLGTFAIYCGSAKEPDEAQLGYISTGATLAGIAIQRVGEQEVLRGAEERSRMLLESSNEGIFGLDREGRATFVNPAAAAMLGYQAEELVGKIIHEQVHHTTADGKPLTELECRMRAAILTEEDFLVSDEVLWCKDGSSFPVEYRATPIILEGEPAVGAVVTFHDITARKQAESVIQRLAYHDNLTELPNRAMFMDELIRKRAELRRSSTAFAIHFLDLDHFKDVNDTLGHPVGDLLLKRVATKLKGLVRASDTVARFGGDEFAILQSDTDDPTTATVLAKKVIDNLSEPLLLGENRIITGTSIGIVHVPSDNKDDVDVLMAHADVALYRAKEAGRGDFAFHNEAMTDQVRSEVLLSQELTDAIPNGELQLVYQPKVDLNHHHLIGVEALVRWYHPRDGVIMPIRFISLAEKRGQIYALGRWVLRAACRQWAAWHDRGFDPGGVAVNVSPIQFKNSHFADEVLSILAEFDVPPESLELELTESVFMDCSEKLLEQLRKLHQAGLKLSIDDFGTGFSSLVYLRRFAVNALKIDQEFVHDMLDDSSDAEVVKAIIALSDAFGLATIAEGVEEPAQAEFLRMIGCESAQGYYYSHPLTTEDLLAKYHTSTI
ncbi:MAG: EAL domain-containing protein [Candidatus Sedimenticola sp. (ex Thyasira tokunagai)]